MNDFENIEQHSKPAPQSAATTKPQPWHSRLGYMLGGFFFGYLGIDVYRNSPENNGHWVAAAIAAAFIIASLRDHVKIKTA